jgi:DNA-binding response OmpR family regulator
MANEMIHLSLSKTFSSMSLKYPTPGRSAFLSPDGTPINAQTAPPTILIVDDDPDILTALYDLIEHEGFRVIGVSTCRDALVLAKTVDFAVVLLDIGLPDGDGLAVLETIQAITPSLPVIILTAFTSQDYRASSLSRGAFSCLTKPYNRDELRAVLRRAVGVVRPSAPSDN